MGNYYLGLAITAIGAFMLGWSYSNAILRAEDAPAAVGFSACSGAVSDSMQALCVNGNAYLKSGAAFTPLLLDGATLLPCVCHNGTPTIEASYRIVE